MPTRLRPAVLAETPISRALRDGMIGLLNGATHQDAQYLFADRVASLSDQGDLIAVIIAHALTQCWTHIP
jgi:hypothetical protein